MMCLMIDRLSPFVGEVYYRVTEESLMERLNMNMHEACLQIDKKCRLENFQKLISYYVRVFSSC